MITIPVTERNRKDAHLAAIRYCNARGTSKAIVTDYAHRDVADRAEIGFLGQSAFIEYFALTKSDGIKYDALTKSGKRDEIKVKTRWGWQARADYDVQAVEVGNHDLIVWLHYDESTRALAWVGTSYPKSEKWAQSRTVVYFGDIVKPEITQLV